MSNITDDIQTAQNYLDRAKKTLEQQPERDAIADLIFQARMLDRHYQEWCRENDQREVWPEGTSYENGGHSIEYYIEADWMHDLSLAIRQLNDKET